MKSNSPVGQKICEESEDRISSLPNEILGHILSFLPTKYAVGTCILSTRWKCLWTSLPNLHFDDTLFLYSERPEKDSIISKLSFTNFVDRVLILRNVSYIQRFRLDLRCHDYKSSHVNRWICAALCRDVQELDFCLCYSGRGSRMLPRCLFTCVTLVSLKLNANLVLHVPSLVGLPKLKTLHLESIRFRDEDPMQRLVSSCPALEELLIEYCFFDKLGIFNISAQALKSLTMKYAFRGHYNYNIIIDAPCLEYLQLIDGEARGYSVENVDSLIEAFVHVSQSPQCYNFFELIRGISHVKVLHLSGFAMAALKLLNSELPVFHNVTRLELGICREIGLQLLPDLLQNSPNLEVLIFRWGLGLPCSQEFQWSPPERVPRCLLLRLRTIKIGEFEGIREELKLVKYFLKNANLLQELNIVTKRNIAKEEKLAVAKKLLKFPRVSKTCQVILS